MPSKAVALADSPTEQLTPARDVVARARARGWELEPSLSVSEWADHKRFLSPIASAEPGRWRTDRTPYLREPMDLLSATSSVNEVCVMKGAQVGFTEAGLNWIGYTIEHDPCGMLMIQPTEGMLKKVSQLKLDPAIESTPSLRARVSKARSRDTENTIYTKRFPGGVLTMATAGSTAGLRSLSVKKLFCDEVDEYRGDIGGQGDPIQIAKKRTNTFRLSKKCFYISTPKKKGLSRIERLYANSDQRRFYVPCPRCGHLDFITWSGFRDFIQQQDGGHHYISWPGAGTATARPLEAYMVCSSCGGHAQEHEKTWMLERGEWRQTWMRDLAEDDPRRDLPSPAMPGFHLSGLYSPAGWLSWGECADEFLKVKMVPEEFQVWVNTVLGETWEERGESVGWQALMKRVEDYPANAEGEQLVPDGVGILVAAADVQSDRLEWAIYGFGAGEEMWLVAHGAEYGDPEKTEVWIELDQRFLELHQHESGQMMPVECAVIDSRYKAEEVYKFCQVRLSDGRRVYPVGGGSIRGAPLVGVPTRGNPYHVPLYTLCTDTGKETLYSRLLVREIGPSFVHFPRWASEEYFQQLTAEKATRSWVKGRGSVRTWEKIRARNEQLDLAVYAQAALYIFGRGKCPIGLAARAEKWAERPKAPSPSDPDVPQVRYPQRLVRPRPRSWVTRPLR